ncbi:MAG: hypothetical protein FJ363_12930, partial [Gemmatimonadetes bacterium]|nr:hypothetical protein [Gemmatimonadota bacterium]
MSAALLAVLALPALTAAQPSIQQDREPPFTVAAARWDTESLGNHRAVLRVDNAAPWVYARLPWRRPDASPATKGVIVTTAAGEVVKNVRRGTVTAEAGEFIFEPVASVGTYYLYYLPYKSGGRSNYPNVKYLPAESGGDSTRMSAFLAASSPHARVERFEAVDSLNAFWPMAVAATPSETARLAEALGGAPFAVFPEGRLNSIRLRDRLPLRWAQRGAGGTFADTARRGEFLAFQLGVWARRD